MPNGLKGQYKMEPSKITVVKIPNLNLLSIRQYGVKQFFRTTPNSIIIGIDTLVYLINFLVRNNYIPVQVLQGILEDINTDRGGGRC